MLPRTLLAALLALLAGTAAGASTVRVAARQSLPTFVLTGRGWGHGVGMPQYGALGYAVHGYSYKRILAHFYPGTVLARTRVGQVRVLLADGARKLAVSSQAEFRVRDAAGTSYKLAPGSYTLGPSLRLRVDPAAKPKALAGPLIFTPGRFPLTLSRRYRGSIEVISSGGALQAVNIVGLEDYVRGVVPDEVSEDWPQEALKAQAVASRAFVVAERRRGSTFDVYADTRSQVYGGVDAEAFSTSAAVSATRGLILTYRGRPATTYFYASSGGRTAAVQDEWPGSAPVPYLVSVRDPYDKTSPYHRWGPYVYTARGFAARLGLSGRLTDARVTRNGSRRVSSLTVTTSTGQRSFSGRQVQRILGLRSDWFTIGVLSLARPAKPLVYRVESELTGIARAIAGARLERRAGRKWKRVAAVVPDADGTFSAAVTATRSAFYRLSNGKASSPQVKIAAAPFVRLDPDTTGGGLSGSVKPVYAGTPVSIQRFGGSTWTEVARAALDARGRFEADLNVAPGTYRARVAVGHGLVTGTSPVLRVVTG